ncbi:BTB/POZ domain-containing protein [Ditylenchus destructor]|uniref:BTB/POZ domain-containing protein n=1 Tax=Ditylenchus destructor TaxID=166010 RepID=A0AAD4MVK6_9BILA|nr:BTB/POZ domain-containing protein [Ditylenchus destructor]
MPQQGSRAGPDQSISSKTFILPHLQAVWQLDVYPSGKDGSYRPWFYIRLIGFQTPDGSLSADKAKSIMADYKIYLVSSTSEKRMVYHDISKFETGRTRGRYETNDAIDKFIHPDGSLLVICEVECLVPGETFSMEPTPNAELLDQNLQLADHYKEMWKSKLFADCTIKVGAKSFPAHKCILGQRSEVFRKMFSLPLEEAESGIVEIEDFNPDAISAMLEYMYTGVVKNEVMEKLALKLLPLADKYIVIPLKEMCEVFLASKITTENFLAVAMFADCYSAAKLKKACANRLAIEWDSLKTKNKDLADELLELMIKDYPSFADIQETKVGK